MQVVKDLVPLIDTYPTRRRDFFPEIQDQTFWDLYEIASPYSMVHVTGFYSVYQSLKYIAANLIPGALVECGCLLGGVTIFEAILNRDLGLNRSIHVFDSFQGFPPGSADVWLGEPQAGSVMCNFREAVDANVRKHVPDAAITFVQGFVENTIPVTHIETIAYLRLDTDFYESTKVELEHYYPRLSPGGVLIIDDYGYYQGARKATDEFIATLERKPLLNRIDTGIWAGVKPG